MRARSVAISAGAGFSAGPFRADNVDCQLLLTLGCSDVGPTEIWTWDRAVWRNIDFSIERRSSFGLHWRFYGGVGTILNPTDAACTAPYPGVPHAPCTVTAFSSAYWGTSLGYAF